jgi:hypothetical protein
MKINTKDSKQDILIKMKEIPQGGRYTFFSNGMLSAIDVFEELLKKTSPDIKTIISTWQLGIRDAERLKQLIKDYNLDIRLLLDVSYENRNPDYFKRVKEMLGNVVWLTKNHSKIMVVESEDLHFCVLSSANFNKNLRYEFFDITESRDLCSTILEALNPFFEGRPLLGEHRNRTEIGNDFKNCFKEESINFGSPIIRSKKSRYRILRKQTSYSTQ